jgi:hypothetical protein
VSHFASHWHRIVNNFTKKFFRDDDNDESLALLFWIILSPPGDVLDLMDQMS